MATPFPPEPALLLNRLRGRDDGALPHVAFVMAHPDDESVGATLMVGAFPDASYIYVTDGAPRSGRDAQAAGFASVGAYARARARELRDALAIAGVPFECIHCLDISDQEASSEMPFLARELAWFFRRQGTEVVITHPYEGGHPDHDASAFCVHAATQLLARSGDPSPVVIEMTSYHNRDGSFHFGEFLDDDRHESFALTLTENQRQLKERLLAAYPSQERTLRSAVREVERYRAAPAYDFTQPPHPGQLLYELFCWNMTGARWRRLAQSALDELGLGTPAEHFTAPTSAFAR